jgi:hypothetical protein
MVSQHSALAAFNDAVDLLIARARPSDGVNLDGMSIDFDHYLWSSPLLAEVSVTSSADPRRLIDAVG